MTTSRHPKRGLTVPLLGLLLLTLIGLSCAQPTPQQPQQSKPQNAVATTRPLHFLVFGDWGSASQEQKTVAEAMARYADASKADASKSANPIRFVISTGDNFYEKGVSSVDDPQWQEKFEKIYDPKRLNVPFISVLGNHDWGLDPVAEILYARAHPGTRWQMDGFYFSRHFNTTGANGQSVPLADFFFIDTDLWAYDLARLADKQKAWLEDGLKNSKARWQIVVGHHPLFSNGAHGHDGAVLKLRDLLAPVFKQHGVDAYLCGHDHDLQRIEVPAHPTAFIVSGAGGKLRPKAFEDWGPFHASASGFAAMTLSPETMTLRFVGAQGQTLHEYQRKPVEALPAEALPVAPAPPAKAEKDE